jgi:hypothetical protein
MSNFRFNLPVDIPWKLIDSSADMMDITFCNKRFPPPFRSSIAIYAFEPKEDELPDELCGDRITYLKVSCSITGYQPTGDEKEQIVELLDTLETDPKHIEELIEEYFGCYGVMLNVSVHPFDDTLKNDLDKYPRIIDFEPKVRDFYQAASETGEILTSSSNKLTTSKSFISTDSTESSWEAGADVKVPVKGAEVGVNGKTGQKRTETDQDNWGVTTDASRERREGQSTTTQLSQMYNLLTGYHAGTNRATFLMLPRPHILQPTDRRTFVQGLRVIEGIQDFFLVVTRPAGQDKIKVDAHLQTGHFAENVKPRVSEEKPRKDTYSFTVGPVSVKSIKKVGVFGITWFEEKTFSDSEIFSNPKVNDGFIIDVGKEITEEKLSSDNETQFTSGIWDIDTKIKRQDQEIAVSYTLKTDWNSNFPIVLHRKYTVPLVEKVRQSTVADDSSMLIVQRTLCTQIQLGNCLSKIPFKKLFDFVDVAIMDELPFDLSDLLHLGLSVSSDEVKADVRRDGRFDFAFKKAIIRKIQNVMITSTNSPFRNTSPNKGYLQSDHFLDRLKKILPDKILDSPIHTFNFINPKVKETLPQKFTLKDFLMESNFNLHKKFGIKKSEIIDPAKSGLK